MPPKGYKTITIPESMLIDLQILKLQLKAKSIPDTIIKLIQYYRGY